MVKRMLFFTNETSQFLNDVKYTIVVIIRILCIYDTIIVVIHIIVLGEDKTLAKNALIPNCLEEAILIGISIRTIVVIIEAVSSSKEIARR